MCRRIDGSAARRLRSSQPPLSQQIRDLDAVLETSLFARASRRVEPTAVGAALLEHARAILGQAEQAAEDVHAVGAGRTGLARLATTGSALLGPLAGRAGLAGFAWPEPVGACLSVGHALAAAELALRPASA